MTDFRGTVHVDSRWTASPGDLRGFIGDNALADTVEVFARETGAGVSYAMWDGGRSVSLHVDGRVVLRLSAVMSANAAPPGVARWVVTR